MFDLNNLNPAIRFTWPENENEWVEFRLPTREDYRAVLDKLGIKPKAELKVNPVTKRMERIEYMPTSGKDAEYDAEINDIRIADWHLISPDGEDIPCTRENKNLMMRRCPPFARWAEQCLADMEGAEQEEAVELEKNS